MNVKNWVVAGLAVVATCASAEEKSFLERLFSSDAKAAETADAQTAGNSQIEKLVKQIDELTAKIKDAKSMPEDKLNALKKKCEDLKTQLQAKLAELKKACEDRQKAEADGGEKQDEQAKPGVSNLLERVKGLLK